MRLPWNLVFTVFDLFESRMLWVKNCHDTISFFHYNVNVNFITMAYSRFHHQNTVTGVSIKRSPKSEWTATKYNVCSKMWHAKGQNATKCDRMMSHSVIFCLILSYFVTLCCVSLHYVKFCRCSLRGGPMKPGIWSDFVNKFLTDESFENFWDQWKFALKSVKLLGKFLRSVKIFGKFFRSVNILGKFLRSVKILGQFLRSVRFCRQIFRSVKILIERSDFVDKFLIGGSSIRSVEISFDRSWSAIPWKFN